MANYLSNYTGEQIDGVVALFNGKELDAVNGVVQRNSDGSFSVAYIPPGTVLSVSVGNGLNTISDDTLESGGTITSEGTIYLTKSGTTAGNYGDTASQTPNYGGTFKVPYFSVDKYGRITTASEHTVKIPNSDNTTYTFATGTTNGTFKVTPSNGSAQSVSIYGLTTTAFTAIANSITSGSTGIPLASTIYNFVTNAIAELPEPMIFKGSLGTGGTITTLPTAAAQYEGFTYKVITAGTYAGKAAKIGDTFICANNGSSTYEWVLIPSGDEPSGTVTSVGISGGNSITVSGSPITSSGTITLGLKLGYTTSGNNRAVQADSNGNLYIVQKDDNTTYSAGTGLSLDSTTFNIKLGYTTSGNNRAIQADSNGNLYVIQKDTTYNIAINGTAGLVKPWRNHTSAATGPTAGSDATAVTVNALSTTVGRYYAVEIDSNGRLFVNVPWSASLNAGTVTDVRVQATSPVQSSNSTAQSVSLDTTISLANGYGDIKNPYGTKNAHYILAGPTSGSAAAPTFRALVSSDLPNNSTSGAGIISAASTDHRVWGREGNSVGWQDPDLLYVIYGGQPGARTGADADLINLLDELDWYDDCIV